MSPTQKDEKNTWSPPKPAGKLFDQKGNNSPVRNKPTNSVFSSKIAENSNTAGVDDFWKLPNDQNKNS